MRGKQQQSQAELAFMSSAEVKPTARHAEGTETLAAGSISESQAGNERLMEVMLERENLKAAYLLSGARPSLLSAFVNCCVS